MYSIVFMVQVNLNIPETRHTLKVPQQSFKDCVDIKSLNSVDFAEWLRQQEVVGTEVIQAFKGNSYSIGKGLHNSRNSSVLLSQY